MNEGLQVERTMFCPECKTLHPRKVYKSFYETLPKLGNGFVSWLCSTCQDKQYTSSLFETKADGEGSHKRKQRSRRRGRDVQRTLFGAQGD